MTYRVVQNKQQLPPEARENAALHLLQLSKSWGERIRTLSNSLLPSGVIKHGVLGNPLGMEVSMGKSSINGEFTGKWTIEIKR